MEQIILNKQIEAIKKLDWDIEQNGNLITIRNYSPLGEDLYEELNSNTLVEDCRTLYERYDADDHAELWIENRGKNGTPSSIIALCEDAKAIENMYYKLYQAVLCVE